MLRTFLAGTLLVLSTTVIAEETPRYDRINLSVEASEEVDNDTLVAVLYAREEGANAEQISRQVNQRISAAVAEAKKIKGVKVQTLDYSTQPIYGKGSFSNAPKLSGWRVQQSIRLESKESATLSRLVGDLQKTLAVNSISYTVSPERRKTAQDKMISAAIKNFKQRATLISKEMERSGYRLVSMSINTSGFAPPPYMMRGMAKAEMMSDAAPTLEAGTQRIQVSINGMIELQQQ
ncbi:MAG: SIMPL domain-containing protein [Chromatiales bacterium]|nr:SIMPL domain-containing protein [Chromatiales bacterium]